MHPDFHTVDPLRKPNWRTERATALADMERGRPYYAEDRATRVIYHCIKQLRRRRSYSRAEVAGHGKDIGCQPALTWYWQKRVGVFSALRLFFDANPEPRALVEARILAGETDAQIAQRLGTTEDAIRWYHDACFDVRDRLTRGDWIAQVIAADNYGPRLQDAARERFKLLKLFGYYGGSHALDALIAGLPPDDKPLEAADVTTWLLRVAASRLALLGAAAPEAAKLSGDVTQVWKMCAAERDRAEKKGGGLSDAERKLQQFLDTIPWSLAARQVGTGSPLEEAFKYGPVEPRAAEQEQLAAGRLPPELLAYATKFAKPAEL